MMVMAVFGLLCIQLETAWSQERCRQDGVEFLVGGGSVASSGGCTAKSTKLLKPPAKMGRDLSSAQPTQASSPQVSTAAELERRQILEQELNKELQQLQLLLRDTVQASEPQHTQAIQRHTSNIAALRAEIGRLH
ncbi:MAG: hypothetical protein LBE30_04725 [Comamonas sp.]|jgi:hypothetical protein|nr:hypothetical protein [Comamonas sp.]